MLRSHLSARQIKLIVLRIAHRYGSTYQWTHNSLGARQIGISDAEIAAIKIGPEDPVWSDDDRALMGAVDAACNGGRFDDDSWNILVARFGTQFIIDLIHAAGYFTMLAWGLIAMQVEVEPDFAEFSKNRTNTE